MTSIYYLGQSNLKAFVMLYCEELEFFAKGRVHGGVTNSMSRHGNRSCCYSAIKCPICPKLHTFDKGHGLKTSTCQCLVIDIAPPGGNRKLLVLH